MYAVCFLFFFFGLELYEHTVAFVVRCWPSYRNVLLEISLIDRVSLLVDEILPRRRSLSLRSLIRLNPVIRPSSEAYIRYRCQIFDLRTVVNVDELLVVYYYEVRVYVIFIFYYIYIFFYYCSPEKATLRNYREE